MLLDDNENNHYDVEDNNHHYSDYDVWRYDKGTKICKMTSVFWYFSKTNDHKQCM